MATNETAMGKVRSGRNPAYAGFQEADTRERIFDDFENEVLEAVRRVAGRVDRLEAKKGKVTK